jgi:hypothetical protein
MKKQFRLFTMLVMIAGSNLFSGCDVVKNLLTEGDIAAGLKEALIQGITRGGDNARKGSLFSGSNILSAVLPENAVKVINTLESLGLASEVTRFTSTVTTAASKSAENSVPIFINGIRNMTFRDAVGILGGGYNAATNYLRTSIGDTLRESIKPQVATALAEYKVQQNLDALLAKVPFGGGKMKFDLSSFVAQQVANQMFKEVEQEEYRIRTDVAARTTPLLQRVFSSAKAYRQ